MLYIKVTLFSEERNYMAKPPLGNRTLIRAINRSAVLNMIKTHGSIARTDIAQFTGLSAATVTGITAELIERGLIIEKEEGDSSGGRRPILLAINPSGGYVIGIKLMEHQVIGALTDLEATIIAKHIEKFPDHSLGTITDTLVGVIDKLLLDMDIDKAKLFGVGIGLAGIIDAKKGNLRYSPIFGFRDVPLGKLLRTRLEVPVFIDNDVNTLTLTEQLFGSGQGIDNFITITIGRGVGMGIVVNGQLYRGANGGAGEFGHTVIDPEGPPCACGKRGCLETYVSDPALLKMALKAFSDGEMTEEVRTIEELNALAQVGDHTARAIFKQAGEKLGIGIANLFNIFSPQEIIISGEGVRAGELLFEPMRASIEQHVMPGLDVQDAVIRIDVWDDDVWARGAASLVLQEVFNSPLNIEKTEDNVIAF